MLHFQKAAKFPLQYLLFRFPVVFGIFHHVLHTLHLTSHLHNFLRAVHQLVHRCQKRPHEALEGHEHTHSQIALKNEVGT